MMAMAARNGDGRPGDAVTGYGAMDAISQCRDPVGGVSLVYRPASEPMEGRNSAVDGDGSSKIEDGRSRCEFLGDWDEIMLIATCAMKKDQMVGWPGWRRR